MSKLRENIDRILGNSIRCLLPSYWWKRLFGMVVDEVESKAPLASFEIVKTKVENAEKKVLDVYVPAIDSYLSFSHNSTNAKAWSRLSDLSQVNATIEEYEVRVHLVKGGIAYPLTPAFVEWNNWILVVGVHEIEYSYPSTFDSNLYWNKIRVFGIDTDGDARLIESNAPEKQEKLVSGGNIKTINGTTLLGSGDIKVAADVTIDTSLSSTSTNPVQNKVVKAYIDDEVANIIAEIQENERVTATALYDLDTRVKDILKRLDTAGL